MKGLRVLLVDDEPLLLESLEIILALNGMEISGMARDGGEALELLESCPCDMALVDLNMKGMSGIELISHMKEKYPHIKILVLTTFYDDKSITQAIAGGADGYLLKDSGKDAILGAMEQVVGGRNVVDNKVMQRLAELIGGRMVGNGLEVAAAMPVDGNEPAVPVDGRRSVMPMDGSRATKPVDESLVDGNRAATPVDENRSTVPINGNGSAGYIIEKEKELFLPEDITSREKEICTLLAKGFTNRQIADALYISEGTVKNYISSIYDKTGIHDRAKLVVEMNRFGSS